MPDRTAIEAKVKEWQASKDELERKIVEGQKQLATMAREVARLDGAIAGAGLLAGLDAPVPTMSLVPKDGTTGG
jgi:Tfp pilus assembly protein FimV